MQTNATSSFVYTAFREDVDNSFRLLELLPGTGTSVIKCRLRHSSRSAFVEPYEALSYAWGDPTITCPIWVHAYSVKVTRNLESALRHLRLPDQSRFIWADAVCINQSDLQERAHQVKQMQQIYANARSVVVWLGEADADSDEAIAFVNRICDKLEADGVLPKTELDFYKNYNVYLPLMKEFVSPRHMQSLLSLRSLLTRPWWDRLWVIQEVVSASEAFFHCGPTSLSFLRLMRILYLLRLPDFVDGFLRSIEGMVDRLNSAYDISSARILNWTDEARLRGGRVPYFLGIAERRQCHDLCDKVFAVLGLIGDEIGNSIVVDYNQSSSWVYNVTAKAQIQCAQNVEILCWSRDAGSCPSWAPSWASSAKEAQHRIGGYVMNPTYAASEGSIPNVQFPDELRVLRVNGIRLDIVHDSSLQRCEQGLEEDQNRQGSYTWDIQTMARRLVSQRELRCSVPNSGPGESTQEKLVSPYQGSNILLKTLEELFRVMVADRSMDRNNDIRRLQELALSEDLTTYECWPSNRELFFRRAQYYTLGRTMIVSEKGLVGLAPRETMPDDIICVLAGLSVPAILRRRVEGGYIWIGDACVHGIMDGEAVRLAEAGVYQWQDFDLH